MNGVEFLEFVLSYSICCKTERKDGHLKSDTVLASVLEIELDVLITFAYGVKTLITLTS